MHYHGVLYQSATLTGNGNSGYLKWPIVPAVGVRIEVVGSDLTTDETLDVSLDIALDDTPTGAISISNLSQIDATTSQASYVLGRDTASPHFDYYRLRWVVAGTTPSMSFTAYAVITPH